MDAIAAKALLQRYLEGDASHEEIIIIEQWYQQLVDSGEWHWSVGEKESLEAAMEAHLLETIGRKDAGERPAPPDAGERARHPDARVTPMRRLWIAAAMIALIAAAYLIYIKNPTQGIPQLAQRYNNDVQPGRNAAVLTLAGGRTIQLDSARPFVGSQGMTLLANDSGRLKYTDAADQTEEVFYNTLTTGKGNQYHLILPDGSKVWLNAVSSITYPTAFTGNERRVSITGEAYLEVAKNPKLPFIVQQGDLSIQVLGTSFDVNAYGDDATQMITLLEGKIKVEKGATGSLLDPDQQAKITDNNITILKDPDIESVMAWKNGTFAFKDAGIGAIMQQVQRWYNVDVTYEANITEHFVADIPRNVTLSQLLKLLEATDQVHFRIQGNKVTVMK